MAGEAQIAIHYSAPLHATEGTIAAGDVLIPLSTGSRFYVKATDANRGSRKSHGIAMRQASGGSAVPLQELGIVSRSILNLGAGAKCFVRVSSGGAIERVTSPSEDDDLIGSCDEEGTVSLSPMLRIPESTTVTVADDIDKSTGTTIDRVVGFMGVPLSVEDTPNDGELWIKRGSEYVGDKPVRPGEVDFRDFGALPSLIGTNANDCTDALLDAIAAVTTSSSSTNSHGVVYIPPAGVGYEWYFAGKTTDAFSQKHVEISRAVSIKGVSTGRSGASGSRIKFGEECAGFVTFPQALSSDGGDGSGARLSGVDIYCTPMDPLYIARGWQSNHAYSVGDKIRPHRFWGHYFECVKAGTSNGPTPGIGDCTRYATAAIPEVGNRWMPGRTYSPGDKIYPNTECGTTFVCTVGGKTLGLTFGNGEPVSEYQVDTGEQPNGGEPNWFTSALDPAGTVRSSIVEVPSGITWEPDEADPEPIWEIDNPGRVYMASPRQDSHTYRAGWQMQYAARFDVLFQCTVAGVTASSAPAGLATAVVGDNVTDGGVTWKCVAPYGLVSDGTVVWAARVASGFVGMAAFSEFRDSSVSNAPTGAVNVLSFFVVGGSSAIADFCNFSNLALYVNGIGVYCRGGDSNSCQFKDVFILNGQDFWQEPAMHGIYDNSFLGNHYRGCSVQGTSGYGFAMPSSASSGTFAFCYHEGTGRKGPLGGSTQVKGGTQASVQFRLGPTVDENNALNGCGPSEFFDKCVAHRAKGHSSSVPGMTITATLQENNNGALHMSALNEIDGTDDDTAGYEYQYLATGWWAKAHSASSFFSPFMISGPAVADYGKGFLYIPRGYLTGQQGQHFHFSDDFNFRVFWVRDFYKVAGDIGERPHASEVGRYRQQVVVDDGYAGELWLPNHLYAVGDRVSPNEGHETADGRAFVCTDGGTSGGSEPAWNNTLAGTTNDNDIVWETTVGADVRYVGVIEDGKVGYEIQTTRVWMDSTDTHAGAVTPKGKRWERRRQTQTTTADANQVLESGATFGGFDFTLPASSMCTVVDEITVKKASTAHGGKIRIESTFVRDGSGAATLIGSSAITYNLTGSTLDGTTVDHNVSSNAIQLRASPESADTLNWRIFRTIYVGVD